MLVRIELLQEAWQVLHTTVVDRVQIPRVETGVWMSIVELRREEIDPCIIPYKCNLPPPTSSSVRWYVFQLLNPTILVHVRPAKVTGYIGKGRKSTSRESLQPLHRDCWWIGHEGVELRR